MQINRFAFALLLTLVSTTASAAEVTASKKATRKTQKNYGKATPFITEYEFDEASRDFHSTVDHAAAMVGYENARLDPSLNGSDYDTAFSILEALGNDNPEDFVKIFRDLFWVDDSSMDGRRLGFFGGLWHGIKCAGTAVGTGLTCGGLGLGAKLVAGYKPCQSMVDNTKKQC